jgi:hypothetical protein
VQEIFSRIYRDNAWGDDESRSGPGSTKARAADFSGDLIALLKRLHTRVLLDAACGDFAWAGVVADAVEQYIGVDVVPDVIATNQREHAGRGRRFECADLAEDGLPRADVILCRDCLVHLSFADIQRTIANFARTGSRYLLTTTFIGRGRNDDITTGEWRPIDLQAVPFGWPAPLALIDERCTHTGGIYRDKRLALWELAKLG